jgi:hypothetical protein
LGAHYSIQLPTKPYLAKYIQSLYGKPVIFTEDNYFGMSLLGFMERKFYMRHNEEITHRHFDKLTHQLEIFFPSWWLKQSHYPTDLPKQNIILINKLFEERFEEDLAKHCISYDLIKLEIKQAMEDFCFLHQINIGSDSDDDISFDALKKKEYRTRRQFSQGYIIQLAKKKSEVVQKMMF